MPQTYSCTQFEPWKSEADRAIHMAFREACDDMAVSRGWAPLAFVAEDWAITVDRSRPKTWSR